METDPLLGESAPGQRPRLQSCPSYEQLPRQAEAYYGDNYIVPPDRRQRTDTPEGNGELRPRELQRPVFTYIVSLANIALICFACISGGIEKVALRSELEHKEVKPFGFINSSRNSNSSKSVSTWSGVNLFIGPNVSFLIHHGAGYSPCIKKDTTISHNRSAQKKAEIKDYQCCSVNDECGMQPTTQCGKRFDGTAVGGKSNCSHRHPNCSHGITFRPCCAGYFGCCKVVSQEECSFKGGYWHHDKLLCGDINCLNDVCGMSGVGLGQEANQWYRLLTPIFLHLGVLHLVMNLLVQIPVGILIEREIGSVRFALIYLFSGFGGCIASSIFDPLSPQVGASGALFGMFSSMFVLLVRRRHLTTSRRRDFLVLLICVVANFLIGTLPYVGNFVHLGGFLFGLLASLLVVPRHRTAPAGRSRGIRCICQLITASLLVTVLVGALLIFYTFDHNSEFCSWCHNFDCIRWTEGFCPDKYRKVDCGD